MYQLILEKSVFQDLRPWLPLPPEVTVNLKRYFLKHLSLKQKTNQTVPATVLQTVTSSFGKCLNKLSHALVNYGLQLGNLVD